MMTRVHSRRMVVISDIHLGNPFSRTRMRVLQFLKWAARNDYDICINGDGLEIVQASFGRLVTDVPDVIRTLKELGQSGKAVYYVVGNHDIALEHFLEDWGALIVCPFLNVTSGDARIRIEHGHLYDPFFVAYPRLYEFLTRLIGVGLRAAPEASQLWVSFERWRERARARRDRIVERVAPEANRLRASLDLWRRGLRGRRNRIAGEPPEFAEAALELSRRGFDSIVFGHTHRVGEVQLPNGRKYFNPGSWLLGCHYVEIDEGHVSLKNWEETARLPAA